MPVVGAVVYENPAQTATSDPEGSFSLPVPAGAIDLHISAVGFNVQELHLHGAAGARILATKDGYIRLVPAQKT